MAGDDADDDAVDDAVRLRQAYVSLDKIEEALDHEEYADAKAAAERLLNTLEDLG